MERYRLVTRSDFDGLVCAVLLRELGLLDEVTFVHPKDMQDGNVAVSDHDITTNLPYVPGVHLAFDHHHSETLRVAELPENHIIDSTAASAARVVYNYFGRDRLAAVSPDLLDAVDKADSARFSGEEILHPSGWVLLNFLMDPRTGLGRFRRFRISNYQLMMRLIESCMTQTVDEVLADPDVAERVHLYQEHRHAAVEQILRCAHTSRGVVTLDLRDEDPIWATNRFTVYALFPECTVSVHVLWGLNKQNTVLAAGKSIINRASTVDIGALMLRHGGGGHTNAGTCQVPNDSADRILTELVLGMGDTPRRIIDAA